MTDVPDTQHDSFQPGDDCPLPVASQNWNIGCFTAYWSIFYFIQPVTYVGLTHANLLHEFQNSDTVSNLPSAAYQWCTIVPVVVAWVFPQPKYLRRLALCAVSAMAAVTSVVAILLWTGATPRVCTAAVVAHGAVFGAANGTLLSTLWDLLRRGVSTSRRGKALGFAFGMGPLFACAGALIQDALFDGKLLGGFTFGLAFPHNYMVLFVGAAPMLLLAGLAAASFRIPDMAASSDETATTFGEIKAGLKQFIHNPIVLIAVVIYVIVYSGGNAIFQNVSLHAKDVLGDESQTLGVQSFLRFGFKAVAGVLLGWLLAKANPRRTLVATTSILLVGMVWALSSSGWWFMLTFGILGAGELFGAYFPNYITTASKKQFVRVNMAYLSVLSTLIGFSALAFGWIADEYGREASFYTAAGMLSLAGILILLLLPKDPTPAESE